MRAFDWVLVATLAGSRLSGITVTVVNMIPADDSNETFQDSEPTLAVHPGQNTLMAAATISNDIRNGGYAPIYISTNGGGSWAKLYVIPAVLDATHSMVDPSLAMSRSDLLYATLLSREEVGADLRALDIRRKKMRPLNANPATRIGSSGRYGIDQPHAQTVQVSPSKDVVMVASNDDLIDEEEGLGRTAAVDQWDGSKFRPTRVESRGTTNRDGAPVRVAIHPSGRMAYGAFLARRESVGSCYKTEVTVIADNKQGAAIRDFTTLKDPSDNKPGRRVGPPVMLPLNLVLGQDRVGYDLAIATDPRGTQQQLVYLAWADGCTASDYMLHLRFSTDGGATWQGNVNVKQAKNPSLAVNADGTVAFLYQALVGKRWHTIAELRSSQLAGPVNTIRLASTAQAPAPAFQPFLGDYSQILAIDRNFYGVFAASNQPLPANFFNNQVTYLRKHNFATGQLIKNDGTVLNTFSIDPFFFRIEP